MGRLDGQLCDQLSENFAEIIFVSELRSDSGAPSFGQLPSTTSNFHIKALRIQARGMIVLTVDLMHAISISDACASGHLDLNCDTCLMDEGVRTGIHVVRTVAAIFP
jgi:hypothetical protein